MTVTVKELQDRFKAIRDERRTAANTAERIGNAFLSLLSYISDDTPYLRKDGEDVTTFLLKLLGGVSIGIDGKDNAISGMNGQGVLLNTKGGGEMDSLLVRGSMTVYETILNKLQVMEGDVAFSNKGTVESVFQSDINTYVLTLRQEYEGQGIPFFVGDVCYSQTKALIGGASRQTSWYRVTNIYDTNNTMVVILYDDEDVPGGKNFAPVAGSTVTHRGNVSDKSRQNSFYISTTDGRIEYICGVTQPILHESNRYMFLGLPPQGLSFLQNQPIDYSQPYIFCRGLIAQDILRVDFEGNPVYEVRDMGVWVATVEYIRGFDGKTYIQHQVWYGGCVWRCVVDKATVGKAPRYNNADWECVMGAASKSVEIYSTEGDSFPLAATFATTLVAQVWHAEMMLEEEEIGTANILWTRESTDTDGDTPWNLRHTAGTCGLRLELTDDDLPADWWTVRKVAFRCMVTLPGGSYSGGYTVMI